MGEIIFSIFLGVALIATGLILNQNLQKEENNLYTKDTKEA